MHFIDHVKNITCGDNMKKNILLNIKQDYISRHCDIKEERYGLCMPYNHSFFNRQLVKRSIFLLTIFYLFSS